MSQEQEQQQVIRSNAQRLEMFLQGQDGEQSLARLKRKGRIIILGECTNADGRVSIRGRYFIDGEGLAELHEQLSVRIPGQPSKYPVRVCETLVFRRSAEKIVGALAQSSFPENPGGVGELISKTLDALIHESIEEGLHRKFGCDN